MQKYISVSVGLVLMVTLSIGVFFQLRHPFSKSPLNKKISNNSSVNTAQSQFPLSITYMRSRTYPGSKVTIERVLPNGTNYHQYIASYVSEGNTIFGLLTVPIRENPPAGGWPVIIFNHGYIQPDQYKTTERYVAYVAAFARNGYIVFKPDYRGHGESQGEAVGAYYDPAYTIDVFNALSSLKKYPDANANKIGMWGHSMGGNLTLRCLVVDPKDIQAAVIWGGVVGSYDDLMNNWARRVPYQPSGRDLTLRYNFRKQLVETYGTPKSNPDFWNSVDPTFFVGDIQAPIQLHVGAQDEEVPVAFSESLKTKLEQAGKTVEFYTYPGGDHNISSPNFEIAIKRSIEFFDRYLKQ
jgi:uncharacterized protein